MADLSSQLKRKRDGVDEQKKKPKKQKKVEEIAGEDAENVNAGASPGTPTAKSQSTPKSKNKPNATSTVGAVNGTSKDTQIDTPSTSQKSKKKPQDQQDVGAEDVAVQDTAAGDVATPSQKQKRKGRKSFSNPGADGGDKQVEGNAVRSTSQSQQLAKTAKNETSEEKELVNITEGKERIKTKKNKAKGQAKWTMSPAEGGWFLPTDPVFSPDEKYLILANLKSLQVYATETSTLANILPIGSAGVLTAYALSSSNPNQVYVADSSGLITLWDWVDGSKVGRWDIGATVRTMKVITHPESKEDLVYCHEIGKNHIINVHALRTKAQTSKTELKRVLKTSSSVHGIQVVFQGKYIIVACTNSIMVGKRLKPTKTAVQDFEYVWRELKFSKSITTFNAYLHEPEHAGKGKKPVQDQRDNIDIAVGDEAGAIILFEDILTSFAAFESIQKGNRSKSDDAESLRPKRLHWHRDAVGAVKWSLDGNYLISGGDETVLTIWQLATGKPQHLPHLTAAIENITVSPSGSAYAVTLANNTVIVLSTTELEAKTNIIGIQSRRVDFETNAGPSQSGIFNSVPLAVNPKAPSEVLFSVPSSQPRRKNEGFRPEPYLQTFDLANHRAKSRQAITRNNATDVNMAPEGDRIKEPNVQLLQVSHDGEWLATVDDWVPPRAATGYLNEGIQAFTEEERLLRREVYLKIWQWDEQNGQWKLETRIDAPHFFEDVCGNGRVLDMVADPVTAGFATVGEDNIVRIWRPKTRLRDGTIVRGAEEKGLVTWSLDRSVEVSDTLDILEGSQRWLPPRASRLVFSADGSVLAVAMTWASESDPGVIHLIDVDTATIRRSITEIDVTALSGLGVVGRHLVVVADSITVWDMVLDQLVYNVPVKTHGIGRLERMSIVRLAINEADGTFAVALPQFEKNESGGSKLSKTSTKISVYNPENQHALWSSTTPNIVLSLASRKGEKGYVVLDSTSSLKVITPTTGPLQLPTPPPEEKAELQHTSYAVEDDEDEGSDNQILEPLVLSDLSQNIDDEEVVITQQSLQQVLDNGTVPPPPQGLFSAVLALVGRPSKVVA